jgi:hypothetical protein
MLFVELVETEACSRTEFWTRHCKRLCETGVTLDRKAQENRTELLELRPGEGIFKQIQGDQGYHVLSGVGR